MRWFAFILGLVGSVASLIIIFSIDIFKIFASDYTGPLWFTSSYWYFILLICMACSLLVLSRHHFNSYFLFIFGLNSSSISIVESMHGMNTLIVRILFMAGILIAISGIFDHLYKKSHRI